MLKTIAIIFGIIMLAIGVLGFVPQANPGNLLLGIFHVNLIHNLIHIATGIAAILSGLSSGHASRLFFQIFGVVYALVALLGFYYMDRDILGLVANNMADNLLHIAIAVFSLYLGFFYLYPDAMAQDRHDRMNDRDFK
jgi:hypothetical protein